jgi:hypothetical protein
VFVFIVGRLVFIFWVLQGLWLRTGTLGKTVAIDSDTHRAQSDFGVKEKNRPDKKKMTLGGIATRFLIRRRSRA